MSKITNDGLNPDWHRMLYSCTCMATVGGRQRIDQLVRVVTVADSSSRR